jgi:hypothetical protein
LFPFLFFAFFFFGSGHNDSKGERFWENVDLRFLDLSHNNLEALPALVAHPDHVRLYSANWLFLFSIFDFSPSHSVPFWLSNEGLLVGFQVSSIFEVKREPYHRRLLPKSSLSVCLMALLLLLLGIAAPRKADLQEQQTDFGA